MRRFPVQSPPLTLRYGSRLDRGGGGDGQWINLWSINEQAEAFSIDMVLPSAPLPWVGGELDYSPKEGRALCASRLRQQLGGPPFPWHGMGDRYARAEWRYRESRSGVVI